MADAHKLSQRYEALKNERARWDATWRDLSAHFLPLRWAEDSSLDDARSGVLNTKIVDSTGVLDMRTLAAGMHGGMTSPARQWFRLVLRDGAKNGGGGKEARDWLDTVATRMNEIFHRSNLYNSLHKLYSDIGTFGTALMLETADASGVHFTVVPAGEYVLDVDNKGEVDTFFRRVSMTPRQIVAEFGEDNVPPFVRDIAKQANMGGSLTRYDVIHGVFPRTEGDIFGVTGDKMPFASVWFMREGEAKNGRASLLRESGYKAFPAFAPRWDVNGLDVYGRSPAMDVLPDCRMLQGMVRTLRKMQHKIADPPMAVDASLMSAGIELIPGGLNFVPSGRDAAGSITPIQQPEAAALGQTMQSVNEVRQILHDGLYSDLFRMLIETNRRQITATEIDAREQEKMILIGPVVERLQYELLAPLVERSFDLMLEYGVIDPPPDELQGEAMQVEFESVLARAQRMLSTSSLEQFLSFAMSAAQAFPDILDSVDPDKMVHGYAEYVSLEQHVLRSKDERDAIREQRAAAAAKADEERQMAEAAKTGVDMSNSAKALSQTVIGADGQSLMQSLMGGTGAGGVM